MKECTRKYETLRNRKTTGENNYNNKYAQKLRKRKTKNLKTKHEKNTGLVATYRPQ